jgi:hypothetical protein
MNKKMNDPEKFHSTNQFDRLTLGDIPDKYHCIHTLFTLKIYSAILRSFATIFCAMI